MRGDGCMVVVMVVVVVLVAVVVTEMDGCGTQLIGVCKMLSITCATRTTGMMMMMLMLLSATAALELTLGSIYAMTHLQSLWASSSKGKRADSAIV